MTLFFKERSSSYRSSVAVVILAAVAALLAPSCAYIDSALKLFKTKVAEEQPREPVVFKSDGYVIYRMEGEETPASLAAQFLGNANRSWMIEDANKGITFERDQIVIIPRKQHNKGGLTPTGYQMVPIVCYHRFSEECKSYLCTPTPLFEQQMKYLKDNNYRVISLGELLGFLNYLHPLPERSVAITIDDGYRSAYDVAYPILKKYGFRGTLFIYTNYVGISKAAITWDQLRELKAAGFEVGSHTVSHCDLTKMKDGEDDQAYLARIKEELVVSKRIIDRELRQNTIYFAYPYSRYNERILHLAHKVGYKLGVSVERGGNPFFADPLTLKRNSVIKKDMNTFISSLKRFKRFSLQ